MKSAHSDRENSAPMSLCFNSFLAVCFSSSTHVASMHNETEEAMSLGMFFSPDTNICVL